MKKIKLIFKKPDLKIVGLILLITGILMLLITGIIACCGWSRDSEMGAIAATSFFNIMLGMAMIYPDMLEGSSGSTSSMRVSVFMIISVFVVLVVKTGWGASDLEHFKLDETWAYVIGIALGAKTVQYFGEKMMPVGSKNNTSTVAQGNTEKPSPLLITKNVPKTPPSHITKP